MKHEGCHPCGTCKFFRKAVVKAIPWWEITDRQIDVIIPICIHSAHELAIRKCDNYEPSELTKELLLNEVRKKSGEQYGNKSNI